MNSLEKENKELKSKLNMLVTGDLGDFSDGYHTFNELYEFRKLYNAAFFNELAKNKEITVYKSKRHSDGHLCFAGGWFVVVAILPTGQITNHYKESDWDLFKITEVSQVQDAYDGHKSKDVAKRIEEYLTK